MSLDKTQNACLRWQLFQWPQFQRKFQIFVNETSANQNVTSSDFNLTWPFPDISSWIGDGEPRGWKSAVVSWARTVPFLVPAPQGWFRSGPFEKEREWCYLNDTRALVIILLRVGIFDYVWFAPLLLKSIELLNLNAAWWLIVSNLLCNLNSY